MKPVLLLENKIALVTGAGRGIGRAIAVAYANAGARVIITDLSEAACADTRAEVEAAGARAWTYALDVSNAAACVQLATAVERDIGDLRVLVNNAGLMIREKVDSPRAPEAVRRLMEVNYFGTFNVLHAFLPALRRTQGCVINLASGAALTGLPGCVGYSPSKGAVKMLTQSMAADLGADGIRINAIAPGVIETAMTESTRNDPERLGRFMARIPAGRLGQAKEIAGPAVFLASDLASYVNGITLPVDGGKQAV
ncbi:SDR family NAD(P)-dependent oxidoreductase [Ottowia pentelensis]|uniref:SDR family NAD(P)-dependent oxidoreductase n=1 Tax=Ottowia pentelensis TaxID=511108 RepID=A0ABV6PS48_9BURK